MSKIGKKAVAVPKGVTATIEGASFKAKGPKAELALPLSDKVAVKQEDGFVSVAITGESKPTGGTISCSARPVSSLPRKRTWPALGRVRPEIRSSSVARPRNSAKPRTGPIEIQ